MIHQHDQSGHSRTQHSRGSRRRRAGRSPRRPVVVAALSVMAVTAGGLVANEVASAIRTPDLAAAATTEVSLWSGGVRPERPADSDTRSVEVGTSFRATQAGAVTGIRFYKHQLNTGRHTGSLWNDRGTLLASVTFQNESRSGWQTARLSSPVPLDVGRWYVVSYHAPEGRYAADPNYFRYQMLTSGVLQARSSVYAYGIETRYPTQSWRSASYYADVLFAPGGTPTAEPTAPAPTTASPSPSRTPTSTPPPSPAPTTSTSSTTSTEPTPTTTAPAPAPVGRSAPRRCSGPVDPNGGWSDGGYYVHNNMWNSVEVPVGAPRPSTPARTHTWYVVATRTTTRRRRGQDVPERPQGLRDVPHQLVQDSITSTFAATSPHVGIYNVAYDIWINGIASAARRRS